MALEFGCLWVQQLLWHVGDGYNTQAFDREHESDITTTFRARNIHKRRVTYVDDS